MFRSQVKKNSNGHGVYPQVMAIFHRETEDTPVELDFSPTFQNRNDRTGIWMCPACPWPQEETALRQQSLVQSADWSLWAEAIRIDQLVDYYKINMD